MSTIGPTMGRTEHEDFGGWCEENGGGFTHTSDTNPDMGSLCEMGDDQIQLGGKRDANEVWVVADLGESLNKFGDISRRHMKRDNKFNRGDQVETRMSDVELDLYGGGLRVNGPYGEDVMEVTTSHNGFKIRELRDKGSNFKTFRHSLR
jgi:hypothetical protein